MRRSKASFVDKYNELTFWKLGNYQPSFEVDDDSLNEFINFVLNSLTQITHLEIIGGEFNVFKHPNKWLFRIKICLEIKNHKRGLNYEYRMNINLDNEEIRTNRAMGSEFEHLRFWILHLLNIYSHEFYSLLRNVRLGT